MTTILTLPALLKRNAERYGDGRTAIREKEYGIWQSVSWKAYYENVRDFALGLHRLGFQPGDKLAYAGDNRPEGLYTEIAVQSLRGAVVGIYPDSHLEQVEYIINHSDAIYVVAGDQEQADKVLDLKSTLRNVRQVIVDDPKGMRHYDHPVLAYFREVQKLGRELAEQQPGLFAEMVAQVSADDIGMINYTSGTTGLPKGSMITQKNMVRVAEIQNQVDSACERFEYVSFLPFAWIGEQQFGVYWPLVMGFTINFPERVETVQENLREIGPHILLAPPRIWEKICSDIQVKIQDAAWIKRRIYSLCLPVGYRMADFILSRQKPPLHWRLLHFLSYLMIFRSLKNYFGLARLVHAYTGGAPLGPEIFKLFLALGVRIKQAYGATETTAASVVHRTDDIRLDTVGLPLPGIELRTSSTGELLVKGDSVFSGYYKNPEATARALRDGWFHSGDAAVIDDDGQVIIIDRMADVMKLADGSKFSPQLIENKLKFSPFIMDAVVIGQDRPYISALISIDRGNVGKWAEERRMTFTTFTDLSQKNEVYDLIAGEVGRANASLPMVARVQRFVLLYKELDADDEELTRTRKVRRNFVLQRYNELVDALYGDRSELDVEANIRYRDGSTYTMKTRVTVRRMEPPEAN